MVTELLEILIRTGRGVSAAVSCRNGCSHAAIKIWNMLLLCRCEGRRRRVSGAKARGECCRRLRATRHVTDLGVCVVGARLSVRGPIDDRAALAVSRPLIAIADAPNAVSWRGIMTQSKGTYRLSLSSTNTMKTLAALALVLLTIAPAQAQKTNLTGKWTGTMTRTAPDGQSQSIPIMFDLTQKGEALTGTAGPNAERQWTIEKGTVTGTKVKFVVQQPDGPLRTFTLAVVKGRLQGDMLAEAPSGQSFTAKVDVEPAKAK